MNKELVNFFENPLYENIDGFSIFDYLSWPDIMMENKHNYIQWIFPLEVFSKFNPNCPLLDNDTIKALKNSDRFAGHYSACSRKFINFLRLDLNELPFWWQPNNHNTLRVTRMIRSMKILGTSDDILTDIGLSLGRFNVISPIGEPTISHWIDAFRN